MTNCPKIYDVSEKHLFSWFWNEVDAEQQSENSLDLNVSEYLQL